MEDQPGLDESFTIRVCIKHTISDFWTPQKSSHSNQKHVYANTSNPAGNEMFKVNDRNTRTRCEILLLTLNR